MVLSENNIHFEYLLLVFEMCLSISMLFWVDWMLKCLHCWGEITLLGSGHTSLLKAIRCTWDFSLWVVHVLDLNIRRNAGCTIHTAVHRESLVQNICLFKDYCPYTWGGQYSVQLQDIEIVIQILHVTTSEWTNLEKKWRVVKWMFYIWIIC